MIHVYSKYKDGNFGSYKLKDDNYQLINGEYSSLTKLYNPSLVDGVLTEMITQSEIDIRVELQAKESKLQEYLTDLSTIGVVKTPDGTKDYAVVIGNDGKLKTVEII